jgi:hypothetical protein
VACQEQGLQLGEHRFARPRLTALVAGGEQR